MSSYEENLQKKIADKRKQIEEARKQKSEERVVERDKKAVANPSLSMHKLMRMILREDETFICLPMHSYDYAWDMLVHTPKITNEEGKDRYSHIMCTDPFEENSCKWCRLAEKDLATKEEGGEGKSWSQYDPRHLVGMVMYVLNSVGSKRTFKGRDGEDVTYYLNPAQVVEIQGDGKGKDNVLSTFKTFEKNKMFESVIWGIRREPGIIVKGKKRSGSLVPVTTFSEEEVMEKLGTEGMEAKLPESAQAWADSIKAIKDKNKAKDEVFKYIITSFDNAAEIAKIKRIELPQKVEKNEKNQTELLMS